MELIERGGFLEVLETKFKGAAKGEGHCVFISGEAGMGKTSLVKVFCNEHKNDSSIYQGRCDALFTPRPLAPLYDIIWQVHNDLSAHSHSMDERSILFSAFFHELSRQTKKIILVFEDIHWADEATLDFIKFFARRIEDLRCLFILTYRDEESLSRNAVRNMLGQLPPHCFTRLPLTALSREAVKSMAEEKGYDGEEVYSIAGGNPFYVTEILSSYGFGIPDSIKDAILSSYNRMDENTKQVWELLSVIPSGFEVKYLEKLKPLYASAIESCLTQQILFINNGLISFKHELFRRTIENLLSPLKRAALNKLILELLKESFEQQQELERIIHHARNANDYDTVVKYAPLAAKAAAEVGAHVEASKLYLSAIEYYQAHDEDLLLQFYEAYAYECYLINEIGEAIIYAGKLLMILEKKQDIERTGKCLRLLSRLWWLDGSRTKAESFARQAVNLLQNHHSSSAKAMALSSMSQLKLLFDEFDECIVWGEQAIIMARELDDKETLSHALNNVGSVKMNMPSSKQKGAELLQESLAIALKNSFHEHAARAYSNLGSNALKMRDYVFADKILEEGIEYCEVRDLDSWRLNMLSLKAYLHLETGNWSTAYSIAENLLQNEDKPRAFKIGALIVAGTVKMRKGDPGAADLLLQAKTKAFETLELQRIIPSITALLQLEWLTGEKFINREDLDKITKGIEHSMYTADNSEFAFWLQKARNQYVPLTEIFGGYELKNTAKAQKAATMWRKSGNPFAEALALFEANDDDKRKAVTIMHELGAKTVYQKMRLEMRSSGIKNIPRGIRKSTQANTALLTTRELEILQLLKEGLQNKEIALKLFIASKTVDHHISSILFKLDASSRAKAVNKALHMEIIK